MYIEFVFEPTIEQDIKFFVMGLIQLEIYNWAKKYQITTQQKTVKNRHRLCFDRDELYSFFLMTFDFNNYSHLVELKLVKDLNNR